MKQFIEECYNYRAPEDLELVPGDVYFLRQHLYYYNMGMKLKKLDWTTQIYNPKDYIQVHTLDSNMRADKDNNNIRIAKITDVNLANYLDYLPTIIEGGLYYVYTGGGCRSSIHIKNDPKGFKLNEYTIMDLNTDRMKFEGTLKSLNELIRVLKQINFKVRR